MNLSFFLNLMVITFLFTAVDLNYGSVYCFLCGDYKYDRDLDGIAQEYSRQMGESIIFNP